MNVERNLVLLAALQAVRVGGCATGGWAGGARRRQEDWQERAGPRSAGHIQGPASGASNGQQLRRRALRPDPLL